jgi:hypothetical protein
MLRVILLSVEVCVIRRLDDALRSDLAAVPVDRGLGLFEAAMMSRCAISSGEQPARGRGASRTQIHAVRRQPGLLVELGSRTAAERYRAAIATLTPAAEMRAQQLGWRHQYEVCQVTVPTGDQLMIENRLRRAWDAGAAQLLAATAATRTPRQRAIAAAAWRAVLLVAGPGRGPGCVRARLADASAADLLGRASVILGIPVRTLRRPSSYIVAIEDTAASAQLLAEAGAARTRPTTTALVPAV